ncbi:hypothetical protein M0R45_015924 [Rubus argutus]|uniref:Uncharacterized protein n=1 Tax=Rubus argutus TaxID=59490 RepID=A0AAW1XR58_RUBAR
MFSTQFVLSFALLLSVPLLFLLAPHFLPPNNQIPIPAADEVDDQALFARAVRSKSAFTRLSRFQNQAQNRLPLPHQLRPPLRPPLAALLLQNCSQSLQHLRPCRSLRQRHRPSRRFPRPFHRFQAHLSRLPYPDLRHAPNARHRHAVLDDPANAFFAVVSQYCVPLHSFRYVYHSLFASPTFDKSPPTTDSDAELSRMGVKVRYKSFIEILSKSTNLWKRYAARGRFAMMPEVSFEQFRVGSQFFLLTRRHALVVLKDRQLWRKFRLPCYREDDCYPEEHYFPTLLSMADPDGCTRYTLTRVNWTGTVNGHPYTYKPGEVSAELIYRLRQSNFSESYLFARKFSPDCLKPLLGLSEKVIFRD